MRLGVVLSVAVTVGLVVAASATAEEAGTITQVAQTAHYRLELDIGHMEKMYSKAMVAAQHPASGEVMVSGAMLMPPSDLMMATRHLEVHVSSLATRKVVTAAQCRITVIDRKTGMVMHVPVSAMYGVKEGLADWHYGNNVYMPPGAYDVAVTVNGEQATFDVTVPAAKM